MIVLAGLSLAGCLGNSRLDAPEIPALGTRGNPVAFDSPEGAVRVLGEGLIEFYVGLQPKSTLQSSSGPVFVFQDSPLPPSCDSAMDSLQANPGGFQPFSGSAAGKLGGVHRVLLWDEFDGPNFVVFGAGMSASPDPLGPETPEVNGTLKMGKWQAVEPAPEKTSSAPFRTSLLHNFEAPSPALFFGEFHVSMRFVGEASIESTISNGENVCAHARSNATHPASVTQPETLTIQVVAIGGPGLVNWTAAASASAGDGDAMAFGGMLEI